MAIIYWLIVLIGFFALGYGLGWRDRSDDKFFGIFKSIASALWKKLKKMK